MQDSSLILVLLFLIPYLSEYSKKRAIKRNNKRFYSFRFYYLKYDRNKSIKEPKTVILIEIKFRGRIVNLSLNYSNNSQRSLVKREIRLDGFSGTTRSCAQP
jgi:hypothetical protein